MLEEAAAVLQYFLARFCQDAPKRLIASVLASQAPFVRDLCKAAGLGTQVFMSRFEQAFLANLAHASRKGDLQNEAEQSLLRTGGIPDGMLGPPPEWSSIFSRHTVT